MDTCTTAQLIEAATPLILGLVPVLIAAIPVAWKMGQRTPRPEEHAAVAEKAVVELANERLKAKVDTLEARASQLPAAPMEIHAVVEAKPDRDPEV